MEFLYIYIDEKNSVNNIDFNFGGKYKFKYNKAEKKLIVKKNENYINEFFNKTRNNIKNVTGIIGENGSGKTSILNMLSEIVYYNAIVKAQDYDVFTVNGILAVEKDEKLIVFCHDIFVEQGGCIEDKDQVIDKVIFYGNKYPNNILSNNDREEVVESNILNDLSCIYFSNIFNTSWSRLTDQNRNFYNISIDGLLGIAGKKGFRSLSNKVLNVRNEDDILINNKHGLDFISAFKLTQIQKEIEYVIKANYKDNDILLPREINIMPEYIYGQPSEYSIRYYNRINISDRSKTEEHIYSLLNNDNNYEIAKKSFLVAILSEYFEEMQRPIDYIEKFIEYEKKYFLTNVVYNLYLEKKGYLKEYIINILHDYFEIWKEYIETLRDSRILLKRYEEAHQKYINLINKILDILEKNKNHIGIAEGTFQRVSKEQTLTCIEKYAYINLDINENYDEILDLIQILKKVNTNQNILNLNWRDISSGEYALIETFSRLYDVINNNNMKESILILIDEGELYLHPEWQRKYFSKMFKFFNDEFPQYKFQIVFTSNTPVIITDIPKNNLVMLRKERNNNKNISYLDEDINESFAANITSLLKNSFFMKSTIGEFSKIKIEKLVNNLLDKDVNEIVDKEATLILINSIGEPVVRKKVLELYNKKFGIIQRSEIEKAKNNNELDNIRSNLLKMLKRVEEMMEGK